MASGFVTIGVASAQLAGADYKRGKLLVQNLSANNVWLSFGRDAVAGQCLLLPPAPSLPIVLDALTFFSDLTQPIFGIAAAAGSNVYYILQEY